MTSRAEHKEAVRDLLLAWQQTDQLINKYEFYVLLREHVGRGRLSYADVSELTGITERVIRDRFRYLAQLGER